MLNSIQVCTEEIKESRISLEMLKQNYFLSSLRAEKAGQMASIEDDESRLALANKNVEVMKAQMMKASEEYLSAMAREKELWGEYEIMKKQAVRFLKELEESRVQFLRRCVEKYTLVEKKELLLLNDFVESISHNLTVIGAEDLPVSLEFLLQNEGLEQENWVSYDKWKKNMKSEGKNVMKFNENFISSETGYKPLDSSLALIKTLVYAIIPTNKGSSDSHSSSKGSVLDDSTTDTLESELLCDFSMKIMDSSHWETFMDVLETRKHIGYLEPINMNNLASLIATITSIMMDDKQFNVEIFYKIVHFSHQFYTCDSKRIYLSKFLSTQSIFKSSKSWTSTINFAVLRKLSTEKALFKKTQQRMKKLGKTAQKPNKNSKNSITSSILSHFNFHMTNLGTPIQVASEVILTCSKRHKLKPENVISLLIELNSIQTTPPPLQTIHKSLRVNAKSRSKWGLFLYLGLSFDYLPISEASELLQVCKTWNTILSPHYYKKSLLLYKNLKFRRLAWKSALFKKSQVKFEDLKNQLCKNPQMIKDVAEVIRMDIFRSFNQNSAVDSKFIEEVLRVFAFYKPKVGYCQGMHYLASTLAHVLGDNEEVFWSLDELIRFHQMQQLYGQDMNQLKVFFFILDRVVTLHVPEVRQVLNAENIVSTNYCVTWFITLFASQLPNKQDLLLRIWDFFIFVRFKQTGWKIIFRVAVVILKRILPWISLKRFEEIMMILTAPHVAAKEIFTEDLVNDALKVKITNRLINQLKKEYERLKNCVEVV
jgi:hypothetical protein